jgi:hypothetical protein
MRYFLSNDIENNNDIINKIIEEITNKLYNDYSIEIVINCVNIFKNENEKNKFESKTIKEILNNLINDIKMLDISEIKNMNKDFEILLIKDLCNYFDIICPRLINNWHVLMENMLRFSINQHRINETIIKLVG